MDFRQVLGGLRRVLERFSRFSEHLKEAPQPCRSIRSIELFGFQAKGSDVIRYDRVPQEPIIRCPIGHSVGWTPRMQGKSVLGAWAQVWQRLKQGQESFKPRAGQRQGRTGSFQKKEATQRVLDWEDAQRNSPTVM